MVLSTRHVEVIPRAAGIRVVQTSCSMLGVNDSGRPIMLKVVPARAVFEVIKFLEHELLGLCVLLVVRLRGLELIFFF